MRRRIRILNYKKAYSICGDRDPLMFTKQADKKLQSIGSPLKSPTSPAFRSHRTERYASYHLAGSTAHYDAKTLKRRKSANGTIEDPDSLRQCKPNFFQRENDNKLLLKKKLWRTNSEPLQTHHLTMRE